MATKTRNYRCGCCGATGGPAGCAPCALPARDLALAMDDGAGGVATYPAYYMGGVLGRYLWDTGCVLFPSPLYGWGIERLYCSATTGTVMYESAGMGTGPNAQSNCHDLTTIPITDTTAWYPYPTPNAQCSPIKIGFWPGDPSGSTINAYYYDPTDPP